MTTINDQPQEKLARYADRTGAKFEIQFREGAPYFEAIGLTAELAILTHKIRLVLSEYGLPSHLKPYKDNPRLPGNGYRVPTAEDRCGQPHELWNDDEWMAASQVDVDFSNLSCDYRLPASVLPPDWDEMTREDAPTVATADTSPHPEIFEAHGLEWYRRTPGDPMPCDGGIRVGVILKDGTFDALGIGTSSRVYNWGNCGDESIIGWRPADAPAKLPRPGPQPQDDVQALKARVQELEEQIAASTPTLRPIAEMPAEVPEGFKRIFWSPNSGWWGAHNDLVTHFLDIRLPAPPDPDEELRREFEAWAIKTFGWHPDKFTLKVSSGEYLDDQARPAFQAFKAGNAAR